MDGASIVEDAFARGKEEGRLSGIEDFRKAAVKHLMEHAALEANSGKPYAANALKLSAAAIETLMVK